MRVLVTGHRGYIGSVLAPMVATRGHEAVGLDSDLYKGCDFAPLSTGIGEVLKDIREVSMEDLRGYDAVMHLAALSNDPVCDLQPSLTMDINYTATIRLAHLAKQAGVRRFIFASSCSNYGMSGEQALDEHAPLQPLTSYGASKVKAEHDLAALADDSFSPTSLRNATAYGVSPRLRLDLVVNDFCANAVASGNVFMQSDGMAWRPLIHVSDIARAFVAVAESPRELIHNEVFNVGMTSENFLVHDIAQAVARAVPGSTVVHSKSAGTDKRSYRVDFDKFAKQVPLFVPQFKLPEGITELVAAFRTHPSLASDLQGDRYRRISRLRSRLTQNELDQNLRSVRLTEETLKK